MSDQKKRRIRSFTLRGGRITLAQRRALNYHLPKFGLDPTDGTVNLTKVFGRNAETILEIGFGMGDSLIESAIQMPEVNFIGVEVHAPGVGKLLHRLDCEGLQNIRVFYHDAVEIIQRCIPPDSLDRVNIFFPDPWHKKKHHKRRLIQPNFVDSINICLRVGGQLHLATDSKDYAEHMMKIMSEAKNWTNIFGANKYSADRYQRPQTRFEARGRRLGHEMWDLVFDKTM